MWCNTKNLYTVELAVHVLSIQGYFLRVREQGFQECR